MATVIIGGGIIGASTAYYLTNDTSVHKEQPVHVIESSAQPFSAASGYAGGFLAKDWFSSATAALGAFSFDLHRQLAEEHGGAEKWGYMESIALNLDVREHRERRSGSRGDDWLRDGTSRADAATKSHEAQTSPFDSAPAWLTKQRHGHVEVISEPGTVGQVDPRRLCEFLKSITITRGVKWHAPATVLSVRKDPKTNFIDGVVISNSETRTETFISCKSIVICAGPWSQKVFEELFPSSSLQLHVSPLAGYSLVIRSPRHSLKHEKQNYQGRSHAIFTTHPKDCGFSPELFSREGGEIYIAGLNSSTIPLPSRAEESKSIMNPQKIQDLKRVAVRLMGKLAEGSNESSDDVPNEDDLEVLQEGLCFRPVTDTGRPIVSRVPDNALGSGFKCDTSASGRDRGGVFIATGHGPWGISQSLGTGRVMADLVDGIKPSVDITALQL